MLIDLQKILDEWKDLEEFPRSKKTFLSKPSIIRKGEFVIEIAKSAKISFLSESDAVKVKKRMCTKNMAGCLQNINTDNDTKALMELIKQVDDDFLSKYVEATHQLIQKVWPDEENYGVQS
jgi:hypothetical protein